MPIRPIAWIFSIFFFALLIADVVFGVATLRWDGSWPQWGPLLAVALGGVIGLVGGIFSVYIARAVVFLCGTAFFAFAVVAIIALTQGQWTSFWFAAATTAASFVVGGFLNVLVQAVVQRSLETKYRPEFSES